MNRVLTALPAAITAIGILNFLAFVLIASQIGGDAGNGKIVDGHYFLSDHGRLTEVSRDVFEYSLWHARSLFITHPLAGFASLWLFRNHIGRYARENIGWRRDKP